MKKWNDIFEETPEGFHSRMERTLGVLEEKEMKKSFRRMPVIIFALLVIMVAATAVAATKYFGGVVDLNGNFRELAGDDIVQPTPVPDDAEYDWADLNGYIANVPAGEYWESWLDGSGSGAYGVIGEQVSDAEELSGALYGTVLTLINIPEGYDVSGLELSYDTYHLERECYEKEQIEGGATIYKYRVSQPDKDDIDGYWIAISDGNGTEISVYASLFAAESYDEGLIGDFMIEEGEEYEVIESEYFDRGLVTIRTDGARVVRLQRDLEGGIIESYYIYIKGEIDTESMTEMLFE